MAEKMQYQSASRPIRLLARISSYLPNWLLGFVIRLFSPQFLIVATPENHVNTLQAEITERTPPPHSFVRLTMGINAEVKTTFLLMNRANEIYKAVRVHELTGSAGERSTFSSEETEGIRGLPLRPHRQNDVRSVAHWLAMFQQRTHNGSWKTDALIDEISALTESADMLLEDENARKLLKDFVQRYMNTVQSLSLPITGEHGDYTLPNVLKIEGAEQGALRVIDWEFQREQGNPLMDVGGFMLSLLRRRMRKGAFPAQVQPDTPLAWFIAEYKKSALLPFHLAPGYYMLRVLHRVRQQPASSVVSHLILAQWTPLLRPTLAFGVNAPYTVDGATTPAKGS